MYYFGLVKDQERTSRYVHGNVPVGIFCYHPVLPYRQFRRIPLGKRVLGYPIVGQAVSKFVYL